MPQEELGETHILAALLGIAEMVSGLTDTDEILAAIVRIAPSLVHVDRCALMTYDEGAREFRTATTFEPAGRPMRFEGLVLRESEMPKLAQRLVKLRLPVVVKDSAKDEILPPAVIQRLGLRSALIAPLTCRGRLLGSIWLDSTTGPHYFTSKEINVVQGIATEAAIALDNGQSVEALSLERRRFEALAGALCDGVIAVDADLRILHLDAGAEALLGWATAEIRGRRMAEVFDISEGEASIAWTKDASGLSRKAKELSLRAHDGVRVACSVLTAIVRDEQGGTPQILYALQKKTGAKSAAERAIESLHQLTDVAAPKAPPE